MKKHLRSVMLLLMTLVMAISVSTTTFAMTDTWLKSNFINR